MEPRLSKKIYYKPSYKPSITEISKEKLKDFLNETFQSYENNPQGQFTEGILCYISMIQTRLEQGYFDK
jgi:hypothetical protein